MTAKEKLREKAARIFSTFAYKDPYGNWWGHDTDLGPCERAFKDFESALIRARNQALDEAADMCFVIRAYGPNGYVLEDLANEPMLIQRRILSLKRKKK
jgi:hypothetical protein